jgi:clan AA aspartic protease (TIGR02281 family)
MAFDLMLDTGATYIFIDEDKASGLKVIHNNLTLRTAGNTIQASLCRASVFQVGNIQLQNMDVTVAPFKRDKIDGLLGMNFFKQFSFYIDQEESILYLNKK